MKGFDDDFYSKLSDVRFDYSVVVAFGLILPAEIFRRWPDVWINVHPSMLPEYRGPSPILSALLDGAVQTGVTINGVEYEVDAGSIYAQTSFNVDKGDNFDSLEQKAVRFGAPLLITVLDLIDKYGYKEWVKTSKRPYTFTLAMPYVLFFFTFSRVHDMISGRVFFRPKPISGFSDLLFKAPFTNISENQNVCFGEKIHKGPKNSIFSAVSYSIETFWNAIFNTDYIYNYVAYQNKCCPLWT